MDINISDDILTFSAVSLLKKAHEWSAETENLKAICKKSETEELLKQIIGSLERCGDIINTYAEMAVYAEKVYSENESDIKRLIGEINER